MRYRLRTLVIATAVVPPVLWIICSNPQMSLLVLGLVGLLLLQAGLAIAISLAWTIMVLGVANAVTAFWRMCGSWWREE